LHAGGWVEEDHQQFVAILRGCKGDYSHAVLVCSERLPLFTRGQILDHARWHADFMDLDMQKRIALINWRKQKDEQKRLQQLQQDVMLSEPANQVCPCMFHKAHVERPA
jgi:hypothetical protein